MLSPPFVEAIYSAPYKNINIVKCWVQGRVGENMSEKEKSILNTFKKVLPNMTELQKEKLLSFGEGMAFVKDKQNGVNPECQNNREGNTSGTKKE